MVSFGPAPERTVVRRVFRAWSIEIPASFAETFVASESYWHAYGECRSISLTSIVITEKGRPVSAELIVRQLPATDGIPLEAVPANLAGWAQFIATEPPAKAAGALSGMLATDGRVLLATITSDDRDWARHVWRSIRRHDV